MDLSTLPLPKPPPGENIPVQPIKLDDSGSHGLPTWSYLPYCQKYPLPLCPWREVELTRASLGRTLYRNYPNKEFDLSSTNPFNDTGSLPYNALHDPHLRHYFLSKFHFRNLVRKGYLTEDGRVKCQLAEYNRYRLYLYHLWALEVDQLHRKHNREVKARMRCLLEADLREDPLFRKVIQRKEILRIDELYSELSKERQELSRECSLNLAFESGDSNIFNSITRWKKYKQQLRKNYKEEYERVMKWLNDQTLQYKKETEMKLNARKNREKKLRSRWDQIRESSRAFLEKVRAVRQVEREAKRRCREERHQDYKRIWARNERERNLKRKKIEDTVQQKKTATRNTLLNFRRMKEAEWFAVSDHRPSMMIGESPGLTSLTDVESGLYYNSPDKFCSMSVEEPSSDKRPDGRELKSKPSDLGDIPFENYVDSTEQLPGSVSSTYTAETQESSSGEMGARTKKKHRRGSVASMENEKVTADFVSQVISVIQSGSDMDELNIDDSGSFSGSDGWSGGLSGVQSEEFQVQEDRFEGSMTPREREILKRKAKASHRKRHKTSSDASIDEWEKGGHRHRSEEGSSTQSDDDARRFQHFRDSMRNVDSPEIREFIYGSVDDVSEQSAPVASVSEDSRKTHDSPLSETRMKKTLSEASLPQVEHMTQFERDAIRAECLKRFSSVKGQEKSVTHHSGDVWDRLEKSLVEVRSHWPPVKEMIEIHDKYLTYCHLAKKKKKTERSVEDRKKSLEMMIRKIKSPYSKTVDFSFGHKFEVMESSRKPQIDAESIRKRVRVRMIELEEIYALKPSPELRERLSREFTETKYIPLGGPTRPRVNAKQKMMELKELMEPAKLKKPIKMKQQSQETFDDLSNIVTNKRLSVPDIVTSWSCESEDEKMESPDSRAARQLRNSLMGFKPEPRIFQKVKHKLKDDFALDILKKSQVDLFNDFLDSTSYQVSSEGSLHESEVSEEEKGAWENMFKRRMSKFERVVRDKKKSSVNNFEVDYYNNLRERESGRLKKADMLNLGALMQTNTSQDDVRRIDDGMMEESSVREVSLIGHRNNKGLVTKRQMLTVDDGEDSSTRDETSKLTSDENGSTRTKPLAKATNQVGSVRNEKTAGTASRRNEGSFSKNGRKLRENGVSPSLGRKEKPQHCDPSKEPSTSSVKGNVDLYRNYVRDQKDAISFSKTNDKYTVNDENADGLTGSDDSNFGGGVPQVKELSSRKVSDHETSNEAEASNKKIASLASVAHRDDTAKQAGPPDIEHRNIAESIDSNFEANKRNNEEESSTMSMKDERNSFDDDTSRSQSPSDSIPEIYDFTFDQEQQSSISDEDAVERDQDVTDDAEAMEAIASPETLSVGYRDRDQNENVPNEDAKRDIEQEELFDQESKLERKNSNFQKELRSFPEKKERETNFASTSKDDTKIDKITNPIESNVISLNENNINTGYGPKENPSHHSKVDITKKIIKFLPRESVKNQEPPFQRQLNVESDLYHFIYPKQMHSSTDSAKHDSNDEILMAFKKASIDQSEKNSTKIESSSIDELDFSNQDAPMTTEKLDENRSFSDSRYTSLLPPKPEEDNTKTSKNYKEPDKDLVGLDAQSLKGPESQKLASSRNKLDEVSDDSDTLEHLSVDDSSLALKDGVSDSDSDSAHRASEPGSPSRGNKEQENRRHTFHYIPTMSSITEKKKKIFKFIQQKMSDRQRPSYDSIYRPSFDFIYPIQVSQSTVESDEAHGSHDTDDENTVNAERDLIKSMHPSVKPPAFDEAEKEDFQHKLDSGIIGESDLDPGGMRISENVLKPMRSSILATDKRGKKLSVRFEDGLDINKTELNSSNVDSQSTSSVDIEAGTSSQYGQYTDSTENASEKETDETGLEQPDDHVEMQYHQERSMVEEDLQKAAESLYADIVEYAQNAIQENSALEDDDENLLDVGETQELTPISSVTSTLFDLAPVRPSFPGSIREKTSLTPIPEQVGEETLQPEEATEDEVRLTAETKVDEPSGSLLENQNQQDVRQSPSGQLVATSSVTELCDEILNIVEDRISNLQSQLKKSEPKE